MSGCSYMPFMNPPRDEDIFRWQRLQKYRYHKKYVNNLYGCVVHICDHFDPCSRFDRFEGRSAWKGMAELYKEEVVTLWKMEDEMGIPHEYPLSPPKPALY